MNYLWNALTQPTRRTITILIASITLTPIIMWGSVIHVEAEKIRNDPVFQNCDRPAATFYFNANGKSTPCQ